MTNYKLEREGKANQDPWFFFINILLLNIYKSIGIAKLHRWWFFIHFLEFPPIAISHIAIIEYQH